MVRGMTMRNLAKEREKREKREDEKVEAMQKKEGGKFRRQRTKGEDRWSYGAGVCALLILLVFVSLCVPYGGEAETVATLSNTTQEGK
mmetsp:Transcript_59205/g.157604  ORF Transcript_59205/g.157604 Transcript_59205/m.157604 type:complete len:88 (+) Transcript_59205:48-311(+)